MALIQVLNAYRTSTALTPQPASFSSVKLLMGFDGADGSTSMLDESNAARSFTALGDAQIDTAQSKFGGSSLYLDGVGDYLQFADTGEWDLGNSGFPFTWEMFIRFDPTANLATAMDLVSHYNASASQRAFIWQYDGVAGGLRFLFSNNGSSFLVDMTGAWSPVVDTWYHVAICRSGSSFRQFVDGIQVGTTATSTATDFGSLAPLRIGAHESSGSTTAYFKGWMDEIRFTKEGIYSANFTPPSAPHPRS